MLASPGGPAAPSEPPQPHPSSSAFALETRILPAKDGISVSLRLVGGSNTGFITVDQVRAARKPIGWISPNTWDSRVNCEQESDCVDLVNITKGKDRRTAASPKLPHQQAPRSLLGDAALCGRTLTFSEGPCTPCSRRKLGQESKLQEIRCRYRESYLAAQQDPVSFEKDSDSGGRVLGPESDKAASRKPHQGCQFGPHCRAPTEDPCQDEGERKLFSATLGSNLSENRGKERSPARFEASETSHKCPGVLSNGSKKEEKNFQGLPSEKALLSDRSFQKFSSCLLPLGMVCLPGSRDRTGRAVVELYGDHKGWMSPLVSSQELCNLLLYFHSIPRVEVSDLGMTMVIDSRKRLPPVVFYEALLMVQEQIPRTVYCVIILVDNETKSRPERYPGLQVDVVTSLKVLHKAVEVQQLTSHLEGTFVYSHNDWLMLHQKLDPFVMDLQVTSNLLQTAIGKFNDAKKTDTVQDVQRCVQEQNSLMKEVLEDTKLVSLQREGGTTLARLRKEDFRFAHSQDYCDALDTVTRQYNQVEEWVHRIVMKSNQSTQRLNFLFKLRDLEGRFKKIWEWFIVEGEQRLMEAKSVEDSLERVEETFENFKSFLALANEQKFQATLLIKAAGRVQGSSHPEADAFQTKVHTFKSSVNNFMSRAEQFHAEMGTVVDLYHFSRRATLLAKDCRQYLEQVKHGRSAIPSTLKRYQERLGEFSEERFQDVRTPESTLKHSGAMAAWNVAWRMCQDVRQLIEAGLRADNEARQPTAVLASVIGEAASLRTLQFCDGPALIKSENTLAESEAHCEKQMDNITVACLSTNIKPNDNTNKGRKTQTDDRNALQTKVRHEGNDQIPKSNGPVGVQTSRADMEQVETVSCECLPWPRALGMSLSEDSSIISLQPEPVPSTSLCAQVQRSPIPQKDICSEPTCRVCPVSNGSKSPASVAKATVDRCQRTSVSHGENAANIMFHRMVEELVLTEREYVRSLGYVIDHYSPLLQHADVPQDLRGQRGRLFGNLEKLHDFHSNVFLKELEQCFNDPFAVGRCFLRQRENLGLYALYSKNKPQSDSLLTQHGHEFFKQKQHQLGDKMNLASYLLKPVQRISKYNLLLQDMVRQCGAKHSLARAEIQAALEVVQFQLRHGNDLLAMEDIQDCDVNLKEQGQLIRQDEFILFFRKKKSFRHIFLFQDLILFSKTKTTDVGNDVFIYKQSFKTSEIGMTHNSGNSGRCFEIWFRRRKSQDTYTLQAKTTEVKEVWTNDLEQILWGQATHSREMRLQERAFMAIGNKPFMESQPRDADISDRTIISVQAGTESTVEAVSASPSLEGSIILPGSDSTGSASRASSSSSSSSSPASHSVSATQRSHPTAVHGRYQS